MKLGVSSYTYVWSVGVPGYEQPPEPLTAEQLLLKAKDLGLSLVQIADNLPLSACSLDQRKSIIRQAKSLGISFELGTSGIDRQLLLSELQLAVEFGSPILRTLLDAHGHEPTEDEAVAMLSEVAPDFASANVCLAIENHDRFDAATLLRILQRVDSPNVGICFDTANSIGCLESAERILDALAAYVVNVHVKDYSLFRPPHKKGFIAEGRPAGQGDLNIPKLMSRIIELPHDCNVILELWPPPQKTLADSIALENRWVDESIQYLRNFIH